MAGREQTVLLRLEEPSITETPLLYAYYGRIGAQGCVPITGTQARRVRPGVLNVGSGESLWLLTAEWVQETHQAFLAMLRSHGRGWHLVRFEDRGSPPLAAESLRRARERRLERRFVPKATPELKARDHLWRHVKGRGLANRPTPSIDASADSACQYPLAMRRHDRLRKARVLSGNFWLTT